MFTREVINYISKTLRSRYKNNYINGIFGTQLNQKNHVSTNIKHIRDIKDCMSGMRMLCGIP
jgi:hypothetical protein